MSVKPVTYAQYRAPDKKEKAAPTAGKRDNNNDSSSDSESASDSDSDTDESTTDAKRRAASSSSHGRDQLSFGTNGSAGAAPTGGARPTGGSAGGAAPTGQRRIMPNLSKNSTFYVNENGAPVILTQGDGNGTVDPNEILKELKPGSAWSIDSNGGFKPIAALNTGAAGGAAPTGGAAGAAPTGHDRVCASCAGTKKCQTCAH